MIEPGPANRYQVEHTERLRRSFHALTGRNPIDPAPWRPKRRRTRCFMRRSWSCRTTPRPIRS